MDVIEKSVRDSNFPKVDWDEIWRTVKEVTPEEWGGIQDELRDNYNRIVNLIQNAPAWPSENEIGGAMAAIIHTAYHLGEIRQALCCIRS